MPPLRDTAKGRHMGRKGLPLSIVERMYHDYLRLGSIEKAAELWGRSRQALWEILRRRAMPRRTKTFKPKIDYQGVSYSFHRGYWKQTSGPRRPLHHVVWEEAHGTIPSGWNVRFLDGNRHNFKLGNLAAAPLEVTLHHTSSSRNGAGPTVRSECYRKRGVDRASDELVAAMYKEYLQGASFTEIGRRHGNRVAGTVRGLFVRRSLPVRAPHPGPRPGPNGCFLPITPLTEDQVTALIEGAHSLVVPGPLKSEWRSWSLEKRGQFLARLRAHLKSPRDRPATPFSPNVEPFDYASQQARDILAVARPSQRRTAVMKLGSQGVIWRGQLWFWSPGSNGYMRGGGWSKEHGRPSLHHAIWEDATGRKVPAGHVLEFVDGNKNNLLPGNLMLSTRNDICRRNQAAVLTRKSREMTASLLNLSLQPNPDERLDQIHARHGKVARQR